uniref:Uncharacterized protein n=1 Tax=Romanomermis culicivorax TaxID=13658 RepID=A0A915J7C2_ROMCU
MNNSLVTSSCCGRRQKMLFDPMKPRENCCEKYYLQTLLRQICGSRNDVYNDKIRRFLAHIEM